jgi:hypothetical protein
MWARLAQRNSNIFMHINKMKAWHEYRIRKGILTSAIAADK